jgi:hypothetical protein
VSDWVSAGGSIQDAGGELRMIHKCQACGVKEEERERWIEISIDRELFKIDSQLQSKRRAQIHVVSVSSARFVVGFICFWSAFAAGRAFDRFNEA